MLLFAQDLDIVSIIRLWDTLLSDNSRFEFLLYVAMAIIVELRSNLLPGDFSQCMEVLLNFGKRVRNIDPIITLANQIKYFMMMETVDKNKAQQP